VHRFDWPEAPQSAEGLVHGAEGPLLVLLAPASFALYNVIVKPVVGRVEADRCLLDLRTVDPADLAPTRG